MRLRAVEWCRAKLPRGSAQALVVNSGNANAFTGKTGRQAAADRLDCRESGALQPGEVFLASTGVIGEPLDATKFGIVLGELAAMTTPDGWMDAARAISSHRHLPEGGDSQPSSSARRK